jgi:hypothetical protein
METLKTTRDHCLRSAMFCRVVREKPNIVCQTFLYLQFLSRFLKRKATGCFRLVEFYCVLKLNIKNPNFRFYINTYIYPFKISGSHGGDYEVDSSGMFRRVVW